MGLSIAQQLAAMKAENAALQTANTQLAASKAKSNWVDAPVGMKQSEKTGTVSITNIRGPAGVPFYAKGLRKFCEAAVEILAELDAHPEKYPENRAQALAMNFPCPESTYGKKS